MKRALLVAVGISVVACVCATPGAADPPGPPPGPPPVPAQNVAAAAPPAGPLIRGPVAEACGIFDSALSVAAINYQSFSDAAATKSGNLNYQDPSVAYNNVIARTALRQSAATVLDASRTPGLPPEVSGPMQTWSLDATKLLVRMGLRGSTDSLRGNVAELNTDAQVAKAACAAAGS
jgi:hypothetical protein